MLRVTDFVPSVPTAAQLLRMGPRNHPRLDFLSAKLIRREFNCNARDEETLQFYCRQLWLSKSTKASALIEDAIRRFPNNTMFQSLRLMLTERRSCRAAERQVESSQATIVHIIWGIGEMARLSGSGLWKPDGSGASRLRELLRRAISTDL